MPEVQKYKSETTDYDFPDENIQEELTIPMVMKRRISDMNIRPLNDRILVLREEKEEKTRGGIVIPDTAKEKPQEGKVVAVGPGKVNEKGERIPLDVKESDRVLFGKYAGNEIKVEGIEYSIMREDYILGVLE